MRRVHLLAALAVAAVSLGGCANLDALGRPGGVGQKVLDNLEGCDRTYRGAIGAGVTGSFEINCKAQTPASPASAPPAAAPAPTIDQLLDPAT